MEEWVNLPTYYTQLSNGREVLHIQIDTACQTVIIGRLSSPECSEMSSPMSNAAYEWSSLLCFDD